ncbi:MAG: HD domain-containing protein [Flammeovirgaceae bacterium]|nr:HD domain-containing protein [Flammeovirgaceae bacterium]
MNLEEYINNHDELKIISDLAIKHDIPAYLIGGYVRDLMLKRDNKRDIDIVCLGSGIVLAKIVKSHFGKSASLVIYKQFGTACVKYNNLEIEFVGARKESYRAASRDPEIESGSISDDQNRRDFTINALAISLNRDGFGLLTDPFEGLTDLGKRIIRTPLEPNITFSDDPLRMMRAIRFASQLNFDIQEDSFEAIQAMANRITIISQERITSELNKIIMSPIPSYGFKLLFHAGLLKVIFPELYNLQGVTIIDGKAHKDNFYHTLQVLDNISKGSDNLWLRWTALLHDIAKPATQRFHKKIGWTFHGHEEKGAQMVPKIFKNLKLPLNEQMKFVQKLVKLHLRPIALISNNVTDSAIRRLLYEAGEEIDDLMQLCRADITSKNNSKVQRYLMNFEIVQEKIKEVESKDSLRNFNNPISGDEIMRFFDLGPSRIIGELKEIIKEAIIEGTISNNRSEAIELLKKEGQRLGLEIKEK